MPQWRLGRLPAMRPMLPVPPQLVRRRPAARQLELFDEHPRPVPFALVPVPSPPLELQMRPAARLFFVPKTVQLSPPLGELHPLLASFADLTAPPVRPLACPPFPSVLAVSEVACILPP